MMQCKMHTVKLCAYTAADLSIKARNSLCILWYYDHVRFKCAWILMRSTVRSKHTICTMVLITQKDWMNVRPWKIKEVKFSKFAQLQYSMWLKHIPKDTPSYVLISSIFFVVVSFNSSCGYTQSRSLQRFKEQSVWRS